MGIFFGTLDVLMICVGFGEGWGVGAVTVLAGSGVAGDAVLMMDGPVAAADGAADGELVDAPVDAVLGSFERLPVAAGVGLSSASAELAAMKASMTAAIMRRTKTRMDPLDRIFFSISTISFNFFRHCESRPKQSRNEIATAAASR
jgi:hypothetical protein